MISMQFLRTMHRGILNSPETSITGSISATDTQFDVVDVSAITPDGGLDDLPILLMIGGNRSDAETVRLLDINGSTLTVERGYKSVARAWDGEGEILGELIAANFGVQMYHALIENVADIFHELAGQYAATFGHIANTDVHVTAEYIDNLDTLLAALVGFTERTDIFVTPEQKAAWTLMEQIAKNALALAQGNAGYITDHEARILQLEDAAFNQIHTNPFLVTFGNLTGVTVTRGIHNPVNRRIEC